MPSPEESLHRESIANNESACAPPAGRVWAQCPRGRGTLDGEGEFGRSLSPTLLDGRRRSWRPRTPQIARRALEQAVPLNSLGLSSVEQALLRLMTGQGNWGDVELLREMVSYRDTKLDEAEHALALLQAVKACSAELDTHPLGPQGTNSKGRPRKTEPYRPIESDWTLVFRWYLPWLFRRELDKAGQTHSEPALSLDAPMSEDGTFYDLLDNEESWLGFRTLPERARRTGRQEARETLLHHPAWSAWHGTSAEVKDALGRTYEVDGVTRRVSPALRSFERSALQREVRYYADGLNLGCPTKTLGEDWGESGHADNKAFVAKWRAEHHTKRKDEELMGAAETIIAHVDERFDRFERIAAMRAETMDRVRETVDQLAQRFSDDERVQDAVADLLNEEDAGA
jgi:hypothetical protein